MIEFLLDGLHPSYERVVVDTLYSLAIDYPIASNLKVVLYSKDGDESLGCAPEQGVIKLNRYWFSYPIDDLRFQARLDDLVHMGGGCPPIAYHGGMEEPHHVLCHEFGHQLQFVLPAWEAFAGLHWKAACSDPLHCRPISGYSLASPDEFWGDCFAAMRLNYECEAARMMKELLANVEFGNV